LTGAIFGLIVTNDPASNEFSILVENPKGVESGLEAVL
jgi:hypothetical protein